MGAAKGGVGRAQGQQPVGAGARSAGERVLRAAAPFTAHQPPPSDRSDPGSSPHPASIYSSSRRLQPIHRPAAGLSRRRRGLRAEARAKGAPSCQKPALHPKRRRRRQDVLTDRLPAGLARSATSADDPGERTAARAPAIGHSPRRALSLASDLCAKPLHATPGQTAGSTPNPGPGSSSWPARTSIGPVRETAHRYGCAWRPFAGLGLACAWLAPVAVGRFGRRPLLSPLALGRRPGSGFLIA